MFTFDFVVHTLARSWINSRCSNSIETQLQRVNLFRLQFLDFGMFFDIQSYFNFISLFHSRVSCPLRLISKARLKKYGNMERSEKLFICEHRLHTLSCRNESIPFLSETQPATFFFPFRFVRLWLSFISPKIIITFFMFASIAFQSFKFQQGDFFLKWLRASETDECIRGFSSTTNCTIQNETEKHENKRKINSFSVW